MAAESVIGGNFIGSVCESVKAVSPQDCNIWVAGDKLVLYRRREGPKIEKTEIIEENATENSLAQHMYCMGSSQTLTSMRSVVTQTSSSASASFGVSLFECLSLGGNASTSQSETISTMQSTVLSRWGSETKAYHLHGMSQMVLVFTLHPYVTKELTKGELDAMAKRYAREYPHSHRTESWHTCFKNKEFCEYFRKHFDSQEWVEVHIALKPPRIRLEKYGTPEK